VSGWQFKDQLIEREKGRIWIWIWMWMGTEIKEIKEILRWALGRRLIRVSHASCPPYLQRAKYARFSCYPVLLPMSCGRALAGE
jgi:hypothetical protein